MRVSLDPGVLIGIAVTEWLYLRALGILRRRKVRVPRWQIAHMSQHVLIADIAVPLLLIGIRNPVLAFYLPRPALVTLARSPRLRHAWSRLHQPLVAIAFSTVVFYAWHLGPLFDAAVRHP